MRLTKMCTKQPEFTVDVYLRQHSIQYSAYIYINIITLTDGWGTLTSFSCTAKQKYCHVNTCIQYIHTNICNFSYYMYIPSTSIHVPYTLGV